MKARANGIDVDYLLEGSKDAPVVTLVHSLATDLSAWTPVAERLTKDFRVLRYSIRGHGRTEATPPPYSLSQLAADLAALLDSLGIWNSHVVGLSIGGMIGQTFALEHGERLDRLIIASSICELPPEGRHLWADRATTARAEGMASQIDDALQRWFPPDYRDRYPEALEAVAAMMRGTSLDGYIGCCEAIAALDLRPRLGAVRAPTLVIVGAGDPGTPPTASEIIAGAIPGAGLHVEPGVSHQLAIQKPAWFAELVAEFLKKDADPNRT